jgi:hypothetical protein
MASTGAVFYLRPRITATEAAGRATGAVTYFSPRFVSGVFTDAAGVGTQDNATSLKAMFPGQRVQLVDQDGYITQPWYRFFDYLLNTKLGGIAAPSITDVSDSIASVQDATSSVVNTVVSVTEMATQNAAALDTVREVAQTAALPGADQIPSVSRSPGRVLEP